MLYREHDGDRPAMIAHVYPGDGTVTLTFLARNGTWVVRDHASRERESEQGGMKQPGQWRFPPRGGQSLLPEPAPTQGTMTTP